MALKHLFCNTISVVACGKMRQIMYLFTTNHFTLHYQLHHHPKLTPKLLPPFARLITPLSLRRGVGERLYFPHSIPPTKRKGRAFSCPTFCYIYERMVYSCGNITTVILLPDAKKALTNAETLSGVCASTSFL